MHSKTSYGFIYHDKYLRVPRSVTYSDLFLIAYSRAFGDLGVSDSLTIPRVLYSSSGDRVEFSDKTLLQKIYNYLQEESEVTVTENFYTIYIGYIRNYLASLGFSYGTSCVLPEIRINEFIGDYPILPDGEETLYDYYKKYYDNASMYQMALGFLYGLSQLGYGRRPFDNFPDYADPDYTDDISWYSGQFKDLLLSCRKWFSVIPTYTRHIGHNDFCSNSGNEQSILRTYRVLSSVYDIIVYYNIDLDIYSIDNKQTWMSSEAFNQWCLDNEAYIVTSYYSCYLGEDDTQLPVSDWND